jgi:histidine kinase
LIERFAIVTGFWRQLKWRIVAANMLVILVGVAAVLLMAFIATRFFVPNSIEDGLADLAAAGAAGATPQEMALVTAELLETFRQSVSTSVLVAAVSAIVAGIIASLLLVREILRPLRQIAWSSKRIAGGHYDERVPIPRSDELAQVATNFNEMAEALARVEETRIALIGDISHELRTPLTGLAGYLEGMMDGLFPTNEETIALMNQEVRRMRRLVDDLQTLSRVEAGQFSLDLTYFDIRKPVEQVIAQLQPQWQAQSIQLDVKLPPSSVVVQADNDRVAQVLLNILGNAIAYTPEGGAIYIAVTQDGGTVLVTVEDTGIGISPEQQPYLFERFYRTDQSRSRSSGGSGIGLTISRHLAWAMAGELSAFSDGIGKGSTFIFSLPLANRDP